MRPPTIVIGLLLGLALVLAACGSQGSGDAAGPAPNGGQVGAPEAVGDEGGDGSSESQRTAGGEEQALDGNFAPVEQRIIKTGEVAAEVDSVAATLARVRGISVELGGYVGASQAGTLDESASLTLRVPADRFDELLARIHEIEGLEVISEATREQDVSGQIIDLEARIANLEASEATYRELVARAQRIEDILAVQSRLDEVRGQIEQLNGQLETIEGQADLSTLTVTLIPRGEPVAAVHATWDPGAELQSAVAALVGMGQGILDALIWFLIVWVPVLLVIGAIGLVIVRGALEVRRRIPVVPEPRDG
jgi:hypothetical protein